MTLQHRMHLGPPRPKMPMDAAQRHWRERHGDVVRELPGLCGYVQNRPLKHWWARIPYIVCAESWFESRDAETAAFTGPYYRDVVAADEARFIVRESAWSSPVAEVEVVQDAPRETLRVLAFGGSADVPAGPSRCEILHLRKQPPGVASPGVVSMWTDDADVAEALAGRLGGLAFVTAPVAVVPPPAAVWA